MNPDLYLVAFLGAAGALVVELIATMVEGLIL
jgi:hypothetical protein